MENRVKAVRMANVMSQEAFGKRLGVTKTAICAIEAGRRNLTEQMAKAICREFNVNYDWLKDGEGEMFESLPESMVDELAQEFDLDELDRNIILGYLRLSTSDRAAVKRYVLGLAEQICGQ